MSHVPDQQLVDALCDEAVRLSTGRDPEHSFCKGMEQLITATLLAIDPNQARWRPLVRKNKTAMAETGSMQ